MSKTVPFEMIQFSIRTKFSSIWPIERTLSGAIISGQSGYRSDGTEGVLHIPQSTSITGASLSDCLVSYPGHTLGQVLPFCREAVGVFYSPSRLGHFKPKMPGFYYLVRSLNVSRQFNCQKHFYFKLLSLVKQF